MKQLPKGAVIPGGGRPSDLSVLEKIKWLFSSRYEKKSPKEKQKRYYKKAKGGYYLVGIRFAA